MKLRVTILSTLLCLSLLSQETVPMKDYVDMRAEMNKQLSESQFKNIQDNIAKATASMDKRLDGMNEFRDTLKDQAATFITRGELFGWLVAIIGLFFGYSSYRRSQKSTGDAINSGDKVQVKK